MFLILAEHANGEVSLVGTAATVAQCRIIGEAVIQSPAWKDVFFLPATSQQAVDAAKNWTVEYFTINPPLQKKLEDDPLLHALLRGEEKDLFHE